MLLVVSLQLVFGYDDISADDLVDKGAEQQ